MAQYNLAIRYYEGSGVPRDNVAAHMWAGLAAANSSGRIRESAANLRDTAASKMTPAEISEAEQTDRSTPDESTILKGIAQVEGLLSLLRVI